MPAKQPSARVLGRAVDVLEASRWRSSTFATQQAKAGIDSATCELEARELEQVIIWLNRLGADPDAGAEPPPPGSRSRSGARTAGARTPRARNSRARPGELASAPRAQGTPDRS